MSRRSETRGRRPSRMVAAGLLALVSVAVLTAAAAGQREVPAVSDTVEATDRTPSAPVSVVGPPVPERPIEDEPAPAAPAVRGPVLPEAEPVAVGIPRLSVLSPSLVDLSLEPDGTMQVPQDYDLAGWYVNAPTPGELGPAVIVGHVDSATDGPAVFFRLPEARPGDEVLVERADGSTAVFVIDRVEQHPKDQFPTEAVYGNTDHAALRLVTCGGSFDDATGHYRDNIVAFAHLVGTR